MKKYILSLMLLSLMNLSALTSDEFKTLKFNVYESIKDHMDIHQNEYLTELQQPIYKSRYQLISKASETDAALLELFNQLKEVNTTSSKEGLYPLLRNIEFHLITVTKGNEETEELYKAWEKAQTKYELKKASLLKQMNASAGSQYLKAIKKIQKLR